MCKRGGSALSKVQNARSRMTGSAMSGRLHEPSAAAAVLRMDDLRDVRADCDADGCSESPKSSSTSIFPLCLTKMEHNAQQ